MIFKASNTLILLALFTAVKTSPAPSTEIADANAAFTFSQWIEGIIADPDGTHLSSEEAVAASQLTRWSDAQVIGKSYVSCREEFSEQDYIPANALEAAHCVEMLAHKGARGIMCDIPAPPDYTTTSIFCQSDDAEIVGTNSGPWGDQTSSCTDTARAAGWIFDGCWKKETRTVRGSTRNPANSNISVEIRGRWHKG